MKILCEIRTSYQTATMINDGIMMIKSFVQNPFDFIRNFVNHFSLFQFEVHVFQVLSPKEASGVKS